MWIVRGAGLMSCAVGLWLIAVAVRNVFRGSAARRWPGTEGRVLRAFVLVQQDSDGGDGFSPQVEYEYEVEGRKYRCMRLRYGQGGSWNRRRAEQVIAPYLAGRSVRVYFDPRRPQDAVLLPGTAWGNAAVAAAGLVFGIVGYLMEVRS